MHRKTKDKDCKWRGWGERKRKRGKTDEKTEIKDTRIEKIRTASGEGGGKGREREERQMRKQKSRIQE